MLFAISNKKFPQKLTHSGVLEFTAPEGTCYLPYWMMQLLLLNESDFVEISSATLPKGSYLKLQPQSSTFLEISNPKAVLENRLRNFSAMTTGDMIRIEYNKIYYDIAVIEVKPQNPSGAISIVEADINLEFAPPLDYVEKSSPSIPQDIPKSISKWEKQEDEEDPSKFRPFSGTGYSLKSPSGKSNNGFNTISSSPSYKTKKEDSDSDEDDNSTKKSFQPFQGTGNRLK